MTIHPQPRPDKYDRIKSKMDTRGLRLAKLHPERNPRFRKFVATFTCALAGLAFGNCDWKRRECAHLYRLGMGIKCSDSECASLCAGPEGHHRRYDHHELPVAADAIVRAQSAEIRAEWKRIEAKEEAAR